MNGKNTKRNFYLMCLFKQLRDSVLQKIDNIYAQECGLYSDKYKIAGRVDCIAEYDGVLSIIDFKTSTSERKDSTMRITIFKHLHMQRCLKNELG